MRRSWLLTLALLLVGTSVADAQVFKPRGKAKPPAASPARPSRPAPRPTAKVRPRPADDEVDARDDEDADEAPPPRRKSHQRSDDDVTIIVSD